MSESNNKNSFKLFLKSQGIDSNNFKYISKDCESYKVKNLVTGAVGYIRY